MSCVEKITGKNGVPNQENHKTDAHVRITIPLIRYLQRESLTSLEFNLVLYIIEHSINFSSVKNNGMPLWVEMSPSAYAETFGFHRTCVSKALSRLAYLGCFEVVKIKKSGVEYRSFRVVNSYQLSKNLADAIHINEKMPSRKKPETVVYSPHLKLQKTNKKNLDCSDTPYGHVAIRPTAMYRCALRPCSDTPYGHVAFTLQGDVDEVFNDRELEERLIGVLDFQECIKNIKNYFNNVSKFEGESYFELILTLLKTRRDRKDLSITLKRSVDHYGLFAVWVATDAHLFSKELNFVNYDVLNTILKNHKIETENLWENILMQVDNLFYELVAFESECDSKMKDFSTNAQLRLSSKRTQEEKPLVFFFDSFEEGACSAYEISLGSVDVFRKHMIKQMNLFFKYKIFGNRELIHDEIRESLLN